MSKVSVAKIKFNPENYRPVVEGMLQKMEKFRNELMKSQNDDAFEYMFTVTPEDKIYFISKDGHKKIAEADCVLISQTETSNEIVSWTWGFIFDKWSPNYKAVETVLEFIPDELKFFKATSFTAHALIIDIILAIVVQKMDFEYILEGNMGPDNFKYILGLKNIKLIDELIDTAEIGFYQNMQEVLNNQSTDLPEGVELIKLD